MRLSVLALLFSAALYAQVPTPTTNVQSDPGGSCQRNSNMQYNVRTGQYWGCEGNATLNWQNGIWTRIAPANVITTRTTDPTGAACDPKSIALRTPGGALFTCVSGVYAAAGGGLPGGMTTQVQFNNAGAFGGDAGFTFAGGAASMDSAHIGNNSGTPPWARVAHNFVNQTGTDAGADSEAAFFTKFQVSPAADSMYQHSALKVSHFMGGVNNYSSADHAIEATMEVDTPGTVNAAEGLAFFAYNAAASAVNKLEAEDLYVESDTGAVAVLSVLEAGGEIDGGTVADFHQIHVSTPGMFGGAVTNLYGIRIEDIAGASNNWALKTGLGKVEFGGTVALTGTGPGAANTVVCWKAGGVLGWASNTMGVIGTTCN